MPSPQAKAMLPVIPALQADDSMLTRKFGHEVVNYYSGTRLNRYSFLRADAAFLRRAALSPASRYVALDSLNAVAADKSRLALFTFDDVRPLIGSDPAVATEEKTALARFDSTKSAPLVVFLGVVDGPGGALDGDSAAAEREDAALEIESAGHVTVRGRAYFAVDVTPRDSYKDAAEAFQKAYERRGWSAETNPRAMGLLPEHAAVYAQARSMIDWNTRNRFCAGCGARTLSIQAGYKRACPPTDLNGADPSSSSSSSSPPPPPRGDCPTRHGVSNLCFPRTDPTMIAAVLSADGRRVLLGRQRAWPPDWYSALAGFLEPGESVEEAVRREVWEESGVRVGRVVIHSTQPWPYPSSLMIGAVAVALPSSGAEEIVLNDKELESARWFELDEVRVALARGGTALGGPPPPDKKPGDLAVPPPGAIAHQLMAAVVEGKFTGASKI